MNVYHTLVLMLLLDRYETLSGTTQSWVYIL